MAVRRMIKERKGMLGVLLHVTGWIILFILPQFLVTGGGFEDTRTTLIIFFNTLVFGIIFYINYLWLVPVNSAQRQVATVCWCHASPGDNRSFCIQLRIPEGVSSAAGS